MTATVQANSNRLWLEGQAEQVKQRILARCPILNHPAYVSVDGRLQGERFQPVVVEQALRQLRHAVMPAFQYQQKFSPAQLRDRLGQIDQPYAVTSASADIVLVEIAPKRLFTYWSLPESTLRETLMQMGEAASRAVLTLRFFDVTGVGLEGAHHWFDVEVTRQEQQRYLDIWTADRTYMVEIGLRAADGWFVAMACSTRAHAPRDTAAERTAHFRNVRRNAGAIIRPAMPEIFIPAWTSPCLASDWATRDLYAEEQTARTYSMLLRNGARVLRQTQPIRRPDFGKLKSEFDLRQAKVRKSETPATSSERPKTDTPDLIAVRLDAAPAKAPKVRTERLPSIPRKGRLNLQEMGRLERAQSISRLAMLAVREPRTQVSKKLAPLALPQPTVEQETPSKAKRSVRLNRVSHLLDQLKESTLDLEAELVLRGKVKPGKKVRIGGEIIDTDVEGRFCVRCVVKDGKLHVPVEVVEAEMVTERRDVSVDLGGG